MLEVVDPHPQMDDPQMEEAMNLIRSVHPNYYIIVLPDDASPQKFSRRVRAAAKRMYHDEMIFTSVACRWMHPKDGWEFLRSLTARAERW